MGLEWDSNGTRLRRPPKAGKIRVFQTRARTDSLALVVVEVASGRGEKKRPPHHRGADSPGPPGLKVAVAQVAQVAHVVQQATLNPGGPGEVADTKLNPRGSGESAAEIAELDGDDGLGDGVAGYDAATAGGDGEGDGGVDGREGGRPHGQRCERARGEDEDGDDEGNDVAATSADADSDDCFQDADDGARGGREHAAAYTTELSTSLAEPRTARPASCWLVVFSPRPVPLHGQDGSRRWKDGLVKLRSRALSRLHARAWSSPTSGRGTASWRALQPIFVQSSRCASEPHSSPIRVPFESHSSPIIYEGSCVF